MCEPATIMLTAAIAGTALSAVSQYTSMRQQQKAEKNAAEYNQQVAENAAIQERQLANQEIQAASAERSRFLRQAAQKQGSLIAGLGASGFTLDSGSSLSLIANSAEEIQYDSRLITKGAEQKAWQRELSATGYDNQANQFHAQAKNASSGTAAGLLGIGGTILGGVASGIGAYGSIGGAASSANAASGSTFKGFNQVGSGGTITASGLNFGG